MAAAWQTLPSRARHRHPHGAQAASNPSTAINPKHSSSDLPGWNDTDMTMHSNVAVGEIAGERAHIANHSLRHSAISQLLASHFLALNLPGKGL